MAVYFLLFFFFVMVSANPKTPDELCFILSNNSQIAHNYCPYMLIYKDGTVKRFRGEQYIPASLDPKTDVQSKDVVYAPENNLTARVYLPKNTKPDQKLPLLVYFHGGGFSFESPFSIDYHNYLNTLVAATNIIAVSVYYRRAPECPIPCAHNDSWTALEWVATHANGKGPENWLNLHANFQKVFFYGDSSGANQVHNMAMRNGLNKLQDVNVLGIILCFPFFWGNKPLEGEKSDSTAISKVVELLQIVDPAARGYDVPLINPAVDWNLPKLGCTRVMEIIAGQDFLRHRGRYYYKTLKKSEWKGKAELVNFPGEYHAFHLSNPDGENAKAMLKKINIFINKDMETS